MRLPCVSKDSLSIQQNDYANYLNAIQSLDEENASSRLLDLIITLGAGSIHAYPESI